MTPPPVPIHVHPATITRWVDGDTVWVDVDMDFQIHGRIDIRMYGINCAEHGTPAGDAATARVNELVPAGSTVIVQTYKPNGTEEDSFGRWLAEVFLNGVNINQLLVQEGLAVPYFGGSPRPVPAWPIVPLTKGAAQ